MKIPEAFKILDFLFLIFYIYWCKVKYHKIIGFKTVMSQTPFSFKNLFINFKKGC